jgi:hypothetical protein
MQIVKIWHLVLPFFTLGSYDVLSSGPHITAHRLSHSHMLEKSLCFRVHIHLYFSFANFRDMEIMKLQLTTLIAKSLESTLIDHFPDASLHNLSYIITQGA